MLDETPERECYRSHLQMLTDGQSLYAIELTLQNAPDFQLKFKSAGLYRLNPEAGTTEFLNPLDLSEAYISEPYSHCLNCMGAVLSDQTVSVLFELEPEDSGMVFFAEPSDAQSLLISHRLSDGKKTTHQLTGAFELIAAQGEWVLFAQYRPNSPAVDIVKINVFTGKTKVCATIDAIDDQLPEHFTWDGYNLYFSIENQLYRLNAAQKVPKRAGVLSLQSPYGLMIMDENTLAAWTYNAVIATNLNDTVQQLPLTVLGRCAHLDGFALANGDIQLIRQSTDTSLIDIIETRASTPDILLINTYNDFGVKALKDREYLLPLTSDTVASVVARMHPDIQRQITSSDGQILALPYEILSQPMLGLYRENWSESAMGEKPTTWTAMLQFLKNWPNARQQWENINLFSEPMDAISLKHLFLNNLLTDYESYRIGQTENIGYDTVIFRDLLALYQSIDFNRIADLENPVAQQFLFTADYLPSAESFDPQIDGFPLRIDGNGPNYISSSLYLVAINPYSEHPEAALRLVEYIADHLDPLNKIDMMPGENEPLRSETFETEIDQLRRDIAQIEAQMARESSPALNDQHAILEAQLNDILANGYRINSADIQKYRILSQRISILYRPGLSDQEIFIMDDERSQFVHGQMDIDAFINTLERRYTMENAENG